MVEEAMYQNQTASEWDPNSFLLLFHLSGNMNGKFRINLSISTVQYNAGLAHEVPAWAEEPPSSFLPAPWLALTLRVYWYCQVTLSVIQGKMSALFPTLIPSVGANGQYNILINCYTHTEYHRPPFISVQ